VNEIDDYLVGRGGLPSATELDRALEDGRRLRERVADQERLILRMQRRITWRVTAPVRYVHDYFRSLTRPVRRKFRDWMRSRRAKAKSGDVGRLELARSERPFADKRPKRRKFRLWFKSGRVKAQYGDLEHSEQAGGERLSADKAAPSARTRLSELITKVQDELGGNAGRVTVVIPCFNYGRYVTEAVESVLNQTYEDCDVIVVDDGSYDPETVKIIDGLACERVTVFRQPNRGLSAARNAGATLSQSEFLLFLDADDRLHASAILLMLWALIKDPEAAYVYSSQRFFGDEDLVWAPQIFNGYDLLWANHPSVCSLIRASVFRGVGGYSAGMVVGYEDWNHWLMLLSAGHRGSRLRIPLFEHRRHGHTMTHDAHHRHKLLHKKLRQHSPRLYTHDAITRAKLQWRPAVSVVMPYYNRHEYMRETLESLRNQTISDFELIVVDDGSSDASAMAFLRELEASVDTFPFQMSIYWRPHLGAPSARNFGVTRARSEHVYFLDSDDLIEPTTLEKLLIFAQIHPDKAYVYSAVRHFGALTAVARDVFDPRRLERENFLAISCLIRRSVYLAVGGMDEALLDNYEDYDMWLRMLSAGHHGMLLPEALFGYRRHHTGYSSALESATTRDLMFAALHARHPEIYGGHEPDRSRWRLLKPSPGGHFRDELEKEATDLYAKGIRVESARRANTPNPFSQRYWLSEKPNILYILPFFVFGGAEQVDLDIIEGFVKRGFQVTIVACESADHVWQSRFELLTSDIFILPNISEKNYAQNAILDYLMIARAVDVVFIRNSTLGYKLSERWSSVTTEVRFVDLLHLHNFGEDWVRHSAIYNDLLAKRLVITEDLKNYACRTYHLGPDKFQVIYNGIGFASLPKPEDRLGLKVALCTEFRIDPARQIVGFCGRLSEQKDPLRWLHVFELAKSLDPALFAVIIGAGEFEAAAKEFVLRQNLTNSVVFTGYRSDARNLIAGCDVLLMTSRYEGLPQVMLEAIAAGVAVVCSDVGGSREGLDGAVGALLDPLAEDGAFAAALIRVLAEARRDGATKRASPKWFDRFDVGRQQNEYSAVIETLVAEVRRDKRFDAYLDRLMAHPILG